MSETISFIKTTNPEVFQIQPRAGGVLPIKISDFKSPNKAVGLAAACTNDFKPQVGETTSKEFRIQTALDETESLNSEDVTIPNPLKDAMYMFGVTISSLIMMAANHPNIPKDYLQWTTHCLDCIKDDFGNHPPNVQGILNHLKHLNSQSGGAQPPPEEPPALEENQVEEQPSEEQEEDGDQTIRTTARVRMGSTDEEQ